MTATSALQRIWRMSSAFVVQRLVRDATEVHQELVAEQVGGNRDDPGREALRGQLTAADGLPDDLVQGAISR